MIFDRAACRLGRRPFLGAALCGALVPGFAHADEVDVLLGEIERARASLKTLRGPFVQERTLGLLATKVRSTGTLTLVRPDRLRWELAPPDEVTYWIAPEGLAYASKAGHGSVPTASARVAAALEDLRAMLGGDVVKLRERYDLRATRTEREATLEGTPKAKTAGIQRFELTVGPDRVRPTKVVLVEGPRDNTEIIFGVLELNAAIPAESVRPPPR
jgi:outer membrane lipoprotein-sorting protein